MTRYPPNTPHHDAAQRRITYLEKLPKTVKSEKMRLAKEKKWLADIQTLIDTNQDLELMKKYPAAGLIIRADNIPNYFRYGYYPDIWQGIEHYLPESVHVYTDIATT